MIQPYIDYGTVDDLFLLLPSVAITFQRCDNPDCGELHGVGLSIAWLFGYFEVGVSNG